MVNPDPIAPPEAAALPVLAWGYSDGQPNGTNLIALHRQPHYRNEVALVSLSDAQAALDTLAAEVGRLTGELAVAIDERGERQAWCADEATRNRHLRREVDCLKAALPDVEAVSDLAALRLFAGEVMGDWPDVGGLDGFDMQKIGEKTGLLRRENRQAPCGEQCACVEFDSGEVECWRVEPVLQRSREALRAALTRNPSGVGE